VIEEPVISTADIPVFEPVFETSVPEEPVIVESDIADTGTVAPTFTTLAEPEINESGLTPTSFTPELPVLDYEPLNTDDLDMVETLDLGPEPPAFIPEDDENIIIEDESLVEEIENVPIYPADDIEHKNIPSFEKGDSVSHPKYGQGVVEKMIKYGNKTLVSIDFQDVGRRLLDPAISEINKMI
jgi:hypothetical protein